MYKVVLGLLVASSVAFLVVTAIAPADKLQERADRAHEWCVGEHDGILINSHAIGHGGLHCELRNKTYVHMADVLDNASLAQGSEKTA